MLSLRSILREADMRLAEPGICGQARFRVRSVFRRQDDLAFRLVQPVLRIPVMSAQELTIGLHHDIDLLRQPQLRIQNGDAYRAKLNVGSLFLEIESRAEAPTDPFLGEQSGNPFDRSRRPPAGAWGWILGWSRSFPDSRSSLGLEQTRQQTYRVHPSSVVPGNGSSIPPGSRKRKLSRPMRSPGSVAPPLPAQACHSAWSGTLPAVAGRPPLDDSG